MFVENLEHLPRLQTPLVYIHYLTLIILLTNYPLRNLAAERLMQPLPETFDQTGRSKFCESKIFEHAMKYGYRHPNYCSKVIYCWTETNFEGFIVEMSSERNCPVCPANATCPRGLMHWSESLQSCYTPLANVTADKLRHVDFCDQNELSQNVSWGPAHLVPYCSEAKVNMTKGQVVNVRYPDHCDKFIECKLDSFHGHLFVSLKTCPKCNSSQMPEMCPEGHLYFGGNATNLSENDTSCGYLTESIEKPCVPKRNLRRAGKPKLTDFWKKARDDKSEEVGKPDDLSAVSPTSTESPANKLLITKAEKVHKVEEIKSNTFFVTTSTTPKPPTTSASESNHNNNHHSNSTSSQRTSPATEHSATKNTTTTTQVSSFSHSPFTPQDFCRQKEESGSFAHPQNQSCFIYIHCNMTEAEFEERLCPPCDLDSGEAYCPYGYLVFDKFSATCRSVHEIHPENLQCSLEPSESEANDSALSSNGSSQEAGGSLDNSPRPCHPASYVQRGYCSSYFTCDRKKLLEKSRRCGDRLFWNPKATPLQTGSCDFLVNIDPDVVRTYQQDPNCLMTTVYFRSDSWNDPCSRTYFYSHPNITGGREVTLQCPVNLVWSSEDKTCVRCQHVLKGDGTPCCGDSAEDFYFY